MSRGTGGGGNAPTAPSVNPMPALTPEVRECLVASIKEFGVVCPVIKDQTGFVLDGFNRIAIATELGKSYDVVVHQCTPDQRAIRRIELNGARRQITAQQWKPLVDSLRSEVLSDGSHYSDRSIAQAVGVSPATLSGYKPQTAGVQPRTPAATKVLGKNGKVQNVNQNLGKKTADQVLRLIKQSSTGLTVNELLIEPMLAGSGDREVRRATTSLEEQGLIEEDGKRGRAVVWRAVVNPVTPPPKPAAPKAVTNTASKIIEGLKDPKVLDAVKQGVANEKGAREAGAALRAAEKELEAARLDEEKREADAERERLKLIEVARNQADKSIKTWDKLAAEVRAAWTIIAAYSRIIDDLPAISPVFERILDGELKELRQQMDWLDKRRHPHGKSTPIVANYIDV